MGTTNKNLELPAYNSTLWNVPLNSNFSIIDSCFGASISITLSGSDVTLTNTQIQSFRINVTGNIGSNNLSIIIPDGIGGSWIFTNNTTYSGGSVSVRTASYTIPAIALTGGGSSTILYSDGVNVYSAVSGSTGSYLPTSGGTISGSLAVNNNLTVGATTTLGTATFLNDTTVNTGKTLTVNGTLALGSSSALAVGSLAAGSGAVIGTNALAVQGTSNFSGNMTIASGNISLTTGNVITSSSATNQFAGTTNIPSGATLNIQSGATLNIASGATFSPTNISASGIISTTAGGDAITAVNGNIKAGTFSSASTSASAISIPSGGLTASTVSASALSYFNSGMYINYTGTPQTSFKLYGSNTSVLMSYSGVDKFSFNSTAIAYTGAGGSWVDGSDERIKDNIKTIPNATELIRKMRGVSFNYKANGSKSYGVVAQELQKVIPDVVYDLNGSLYVNYSIFAGFFIEAIKELEARIAELEAAP